MNGGQLVKPLCFKSAVIDAAVEAFFFKLGVAQLRPCGAPLLQCFRSAPVCGRDSVEYIIPGFIPDAVPAFVQHILAVLFGVPCAIFL